MKLYFILFFALFFYAIILSLWSYIKDIDSNFQSSERTSLLLQCKNNHIDTSDELNDKSILVGWLNFEGSFKDEVRNSFPSMNQEVFLTKDR
jgi:hypothetical protein